ncbi:MAG TPA: PEP-CTERM sorting domain-containing protein [Caulobacteraceae bacterium]|jgi:hypothetical protein|nr:PEP-CTERM sorting domain-containing protein [Caulobacteraceae bacterium]
MRICALAAFAAASTLAAGAASASVLYDNGPINGTINAWTVAEGFAVSDSFTLSSAATVTGVNFGVWELPGDTTSTVDWAIATAPAAYPDTGTASVTNGPTTINGFGLAVGEDSFSITPTHLAAGTYYIVLQNASVTNGDPLFWDENDGPSTASQLGTGVIGSESFQILGASVPEPSSWALMMAGVFGMGAVLRRRRDAMAIAA